MSDFDTADLSKMSMMDILDKAKAEQDRRSKAGIKPSIDVGNMGLQAIRQGALDVLADRVAEESVIRDRIVNR